MKHVPPELSSSQRQRLWTQLGGQMCFTAIAYYLTARLGLLIPYMGQHVCLVWLPTGVAVAAYLRWGHGMVLPVAIAALVVNVQAGGPEWMAAGVAFGNALGPWVTSRWLTLSGLDRSFARRDDLLLYLAAIVPGMAVTATNGVVWLHLADLLSWEQLPSAWMSWWTGDAVGVLLAGVPLISVSRTSFRNTFLDSRGVLNVLLLLFVAMCGLVEFTPWIPVGSGVHFVFLALPLSLITLLALRSGTFAASAAVLILSIIAAFGTAHGFGPFTKDSPQEGIFTLWAYLSVQASTSVLISGLVAQLLTNRNQLNVLYTHSPKAILIMNPVNDGMEANPAAITLLQIDDAFTKHLNVDNAPNGNARQLKQWISDLAGKNVQGQYRVFDFSGTDLSTFQVECHAFPFQAAQGEEKFVMTLRDVTAQINAVNARTQSEARLQSITDASPTLMAEVGADGLIRFANRAYREQFLQDADASIVGRPLTDVIGTQACTEIAPYLRSVAQGKKVSYERKMLGPSGVRWLNATLLPTEKSAQGTYGFYAIAHDCTESKLATLALRASEARLRSITDQLPARISYIDKDRRYRFLNWAYEQSFGRPRTSMYGLEVREVIGDGAYSQVEAHIDKVLRGEHVEFDSELVTREGYRSYHANYIPQYAADGQAIEGFVAIIVDTTAQKMEERRLIQLSQLDPLTGLLNRSGLDLRLQEVIDRSVITKRIFAVLFIDLDGFKQVNDRHGHQTGDLLLCGFAARMRKVTRSSDALARLGGDEFVVVLEDLSQPADAERVAQDILEANKEPFVFEKCTVNITASIGIAIHIRHTSITRREILHQADEQLYIAKKAGKNRFSSNMSGSQSSLF